MTPKFESFLSHLETPNNKSLLETIKTGFKAISEGYADVRDESIPTIDLFNERAAMTAQNFGNPVLNFLKNSQSEYEHLYRKTDEDPELDNSSKTLHFEDTRKEWDYTTENKDSDGNWGLNLKDTSDTDV